MSDATRKLLDALGAFLATYARTQESGDHGDWDWEADPELLAVRAAMADVEADGDGWIAMADRMPEKGREVDVWAVIGWMLVPVALRLTRVHWWTWSDGTVAWSAPIDSGYRLTHWRPIPGPPRDQAHG